MILSWIKYALMLRCPMVTTATQKKSLAAVWSKQRINDRISRARESDNACMQTGDYEIVARLT